QAVPVMSAPDPASARMLAARFRQVPTALQQAGERFLEGAAAGRTPAAICVSRSANVIEGYLSSPVDQDLFATVTGPADWDSEPEWRSALAELVSDRIRPAFRRLADVL